MSKSNKIAVIDIASRKIVCIIASVNGNGEAKLLGYGHQLSEGIKAGIIIDIKLAEKSILAALNAAEKMAGEAIDEAYINISSSSLTSHHIDVESKILGHEVTYRDIDVIIQKGKEVFESADTEIIQVIPLTYKIDDTEGIKDPIGMFGQVISTNLHIVSVSSTLIKNIRNCLSKCHVSIKDFIVSAYASGLATLSNDDMEIGSCVVDIGAGNTSIAIFAEGYPLYFSSIPVGGLHITKDIALGLSVSLPFAERLKVIHGSAVTTDKDDIDRIELNDDMEKNIGKSIMRAELTEIIRPRVEEILELAKNNLEKSGLYSFSGNKVVITGGSSQLQGMQEIAAHMFRKHISIGKLKDLAGMPESSKNSAFATAVGMVLYAAIQKNKAEPQNRFKGMDIVKSKNIRKPKTFKIIEWFKRNF